MTSPASKQAAEKLATVLGTTSKLFAGMRQIFNVAGLPEALSYLKSATGISFPMFAQDDAGNTIGPLGPDGTRQAWLDRHEADHAAMGNLVTIENDELTGGISILGPDGKPYDDGSAQAQYLMWRLRNNVGNCSILVCSDSTGNETSEWVYLVSQMLATQYPAFTVRYRLWNDGTLDYDAAATISTGTGANYLDVFNFAVAGARPELPLAKRYKKAVLDIVDTSIYTTSSDVLHLYIINHGHNISGVPTEQGVMLQYQRNIEQVLRDHQTAGVMVVGQNPTKDSTANDQKYKAAKRMAAKKGWAFADAGRGFYDANKAESLYLDTVHPSQGLGSDAAPTGQRLYVKAVMANLIYRPQSLIGNKSALYGQQYNILANGSFNTYTVPASSPDGWTLTNCTAAKDATLYDSPKGYSCKLTGSGSGQSYMYIDLTAAQLASVKGKWITLAVRKFVPSGVSSGSVGRIALNSTSNTGNSSIPFGGIDGGWIWEFVSLFVKTTDSYVRAILYADTASNSTAVINFDRAVLLFGDEPGDSL